MATLISSISTGPIPTSLLRLHSGREIDFLCIAWIFDTPLSSELVSSHSPNTCPSIPLSRAALLEIFISSMVMVLSQRMWSSLGPFLPTFTEGGSVKCFPRFNGPLWFRRCDLFHVRAERVKEVAKALVEADTPDSPWELDWREY